MNITVHEAGLYTLINGHYYTHKLFNGSTANNNHQNRILGAEILFKKLIKTCKIGKNDMEALLKLMVGRVITLM